MNPNSEISQDARAYGYGTAEHGHHHSYLLPTVETVLASMRPQRVFDLGCGNGSVAAYLTRMGYHVVGVDPSSDGIRRGREEHPGLELHEGSAYDDLKTVYGTFPAVISLEVVEHLYYPRQYAATLYDLVEPGGVAVVSTPYHGYWKNLALAVMGRWDAHLNPLWNHGHIKFWSMKTLRRLLTEAGFTSVEYVRVGRVPALAKSMIAVARR